MKLGPKVLGEEEFQRQQKAEEEARKRAFVYGPRVVGSAPAPDASGKKELAASGGSGKPDQPGSAGGEETLSLAKLEKALEGELSDEALDGYIAAEFDRPEPRKGALRLLLKAEQSRGEAARPEIIAELESALKEE